MRRLAPLILLVLTMAALAGPAGASVAADYVNAGGAALRLKKTGAGGFVPEYTQFDSRGSATAKDREKSVQARSKIAERFRLSRRRVGPAFSV